MESVNTVYVPKEGRQPVCNGLDQSGELVWDLKIKEPWHQRMFPVKYHGDLSEQWMWLCIREKGLEWEASHD